MFDMRQLQVDQLGPLTHTERTVLQAIAKGDSSREAAQRGGLGEDEVYRLVAWALEELEPAPAGRTMADVHAETGARPATPDEVAEFERVYGASLPADDEG